MGHIWSFYRALDGPCVGKRRGAASRKQVGVLRLSLSLLSPTIVPRSRYIRHPMRKFFSQEHKFSGFKKRVKELPFSSSRKEKGWQVLKSVLQAVRDCSDICPPLKTTLSAVLELADLVDVSEPITLAEVQSYTDTHGHIERQRDTGKVLRCCEEDRTAPEDSHQVFRDDIQ